MAENVRESVIEAYGLRQIKRWALRRKCKVLIKKIEGWRGWPDRIVLFSYPSTHWLEFKRPRGGKFEPLQQRKHAELRGMGYVVRVVNTRDLVDRYIEELDQYDSPHLLLPEPYYGDPCLKPPNICEPGGKTIVQRQRISSRTSIRRVE